MFQEKYIIIHGEIFIYSYLQLRLISIRSPSRARQTRDMIYVVAVALVDNIFLCFAVSSVIDST